MRPPRVNGSVSHRSTGVVRDLCAASLASHQTLGHDAQDALTEGTSVLEEEITLSSIEAEVSPLYWFAELAASRSPLPLDRCSSGSLSSLEPESSPDGCSVARRGVKRARPLTTVYPDVTEDPSDSSAPSNPSDAEECLGAQPILSPIAPTVDTIERPSTSIVVQNEGESWMRKALPEVQLLWKRLGPRWPSSEGVQQLFEGKFEVIKQPMITVRESITNTQLLSQLVTSGRESSCSTDADLPFFEKFGERLVQAIETPSVPRTSPAESSIVTLVPLSALSAWVRDDVFKVCLLTLMFPGVFKHEFEISDLHRTTCLDILESFAAGKPLTMTRWLAEVLAFPPHASLQIGDRPIQSDEQRFLRLTKSFEQAALAGAAPSIIDFLNDMSLLGLEDHFSERYEVAVMARPFVQCLAKECAATSGPLAQFRLRSRGSPNIVFEWPMRGLVPPFVTYRSSDNRFATVVGLNDPMLGVVTTIPIYVPDASSSATFWEPESLYGAKVVAGHSSGCAHYRRCHQHSSPF